jgi:hypothetical protein
LRSSEEMSNSMDELPLSSLKSLPKYSYHLFLISSALVRSRSVTSLRIGVHEETKDKICCFYFRLRTKI